MRRWQFLLTGAGFERHRSSKAAEHAVAARIVAADGEAAS